MKLREYRTFNVWIVIRRSEEVPGQWLAHCLDIDVVTQGNSIKHVLSMAREAAGATISDDLNRKADPNDRRAPASFWKEMFQLLERGRPIARMDEASEQDTLALVVQLPFFAYRDHHRRRALPRTRPPVIWAEPQPQSAAP